ncbi:MAG: redoxin family protein [Rickettsiales bacterium]|nr:redoxin family protein [Rickettsiales bacterium]
MSPKKMMIAFVVIAAAIWMFSDMQRDASRAASTEADQSNLAPDVTFLSLYDDDAAELSDYRGQYVLLNFWATWCGPCVKEFPRLLEFAADNSEDLQLITLSLDKTPRLAKTFIDALQGSDESSLENAFHSWDEGGTIGNEIFQTYRLPESILIDREGRMVKKYVGELNIPDLLQIEQMIEASADPS